MQRDGRPWAAIFCLGIDPKGSIRISPGRLRLSRLEDTAGRNLPVAIGYPKLHSRRHSGEARISVLEVVAASVDFVALLMFGFMFFVCHSEAQRRNLLSDCLHSIGKFALGSERLCHS
jgi:hypothetical protein